MAKVAVGAAAVAVGGAATYGYLTTRPKSLTEATFDTGFINYPGEVIQDAGVENGFYEDEGIKLDIVQSSGGSQALQLLATGKTQFAIGDISAVIAAQVQGQPVKSISVLNHVAAFSVITLKPIVPKDLEGMTLGTTVGNSTPLVFPFWAQSTGVDTAKVNFISESFPVLFPALLDGKLDGVAVFADNAAAQSVLTGTKLYAMPFSNYVNMGYGTMLNTSEDMITHNPDLVRAWLRATWKSFDWTMNNLDKAASIFVDKHVGVQKDALLAQYQYQANNFILGGDGAGKTGTAHGVVDFDTIQINIDIVGKYLLQRQLPSTLTPQAVCTNQFLT